MMPISIGIPEEKKHRFLQVDGVQHCVRVNKHLLSERLGATPHNTLFCQRSPTLINSRIRWQWVKLNAAFRDKQQGKFPTKITLRGRTNRFPILTEFLGNNHKNSNTTGLSKTWSELTIGVIDIVFHCPYGITDKNGRFLWFFECKSLKSTPNF